MALSNPTEDKSGRYLLFDIETDGLIPEMTVIHCLVIHDLLTGEEHIFEGARKFGKNSPSIEDGLDMLKRAIGLSGHNIISYDLPAIQKLHPDFTWEGKKIYDTLVMSQLAIPQLKQLDYDAHRDGKLNGKHIGRHGLDAWGARLGNAKIDYKAWALENGIAKEDVYRIYTREMLDYCLQDVRLNVQLFRMLKRKRVSEKAQELEHQMAELMALQERNGFPFDYDKAWKLYGELEAKLVDPLKRAKEIFQPWYVSKGEVTPSATRNIGLPQYGTSMVPRFHKISGKPIKPEEVFNVYEEYTQGHPYTKVKLQEFNPKSRQQLIDRLMTVYGWQPTDQTESGEWALDDETLMGLPYEAAPLLAEAFLLEKRKAAIGDGKQAWLSHARKGPDGVWRIHGRCNPQGTATYRATHSSPNMGQVPSVKNAKGKVPYGYECRELFYAPEGWLMVGCDASGLELRMLGHYLAPYDGGAYGILASTGDVHTANKDYAGLDTRDRAKRWVYAFLYGSGSYLLGAIAGVTPGDEIMALLARPEASDKRVRSRAHKALEKEGIPWTAENFATFLKGDILKKQFTKNFPGLENLLKAIKTEFDENRRYLKAIDGRYLYARSPHSALNFLLQSGGAITCKRWLVEVDLAFKARGWVSGQDYMTCAWVHDETQFLARPEIADEAGRIAAECVARAGAYYDLAVPLAGEFKVGRNWAETH